MTAPITTHRKVFVVPASEWAEADQPAVHGRNVALVRRGPVEQDRPWLTNPKTATERQAASLLAERDDGDDGDR